MEGGGVRWVGEVAAFRIGRDGATVFGWKKAAQEADRLRKLLLLRA